MRDIVGREITVGDKVAFNPPSFKGLTLGNVIKFTPKKVTVQYKDWRGEKETCHIYPFDLVVVV